MVPSSFIWVSRVFSLRICSVLPVRLSHRASLSKNDTNLNKRYANGRRIRPLDHYHPVVKKIKDPEKLRREPRYLTQWRVHEDEFWYDFRNFLHYRDFFPSSDDRRTKSTVTNRRNYYDVDRYLPKWKAMGQIPEPHEAEEFVPAYQEFWRRSADVTPSDIAHVLTIIARWYAVGLKPLNLVSEALRLLPHSTSRQAIVLSMYYKSHCNRMGIPRDEDCFEFVEKFILENGSSLRMLEIHAICAGFFFSERRFTHPVSAIVAKRYFELKLRKIYPWTDDDHGVFKQLSLDHHRDQEEMRLLMPALNAAGFFEVCDSRPFNGIHDVHFLLQYASARSYHDPILLGKCADIVGRLVEKRQFLDIRSKDISRALLQFANLNYRPSDDIIKACVDFFRRNAIPEMKEIFGISLLHFLDAASLLDIYPYDIIDAFFSSDLVEVVRGGLPNMKGGYGHMAMTDPWIYLLNFDQILEIMCPDYEGARLSEKTKALAKKHRPTKGTQYRGEKTVEAFRSSLNRAVSVGSKKMFDVEFVGLERLVSSKPLPDLTIYLDEGGNPLPLNSRQKPFRKFAIQATCRDHYLEDSVALDWAMKPVMRRGIECVRRLGYEVFVISFLDIESCEDVDALASDVWSRYRHSSEN